MSGTAFGLPKRGILISAPDSPSSLRANATHKCSGVSDDIKINQAIQEANGGLVEIAEGSYSISNKILLDIEGTIFRGNGTITEASILQTLFHITASNCQINGLNLNGIEDADTFQVDITDLRSLILIESAGNLVTNVTGSAKPVFVRDELGIDNRMMVNDFTGFGADDIPSLNYHVNFYLRGAHNCIIANNKAQYIGGGCTVGATAQNLIVANNRFSDFWDNATYISSGDGCVIGGNNYTNGNGTFSSGIKVRGNFNSVVNNVLRTIGSGITVSGLGTVSANEGTVTFRRSILNFSGGSVEPRLGETITGDTNGATGRVTRYFHQSGRYASSNAKGYIFIEPTNKFARPSASCAASTNLITSTAHGLNNDDQILLLAFPTTTGIADNIKYYVANSTTNSFSVSTSPSNGDPVDILIDETGQWTKALTVNTGTNVITVPTHGLSDGNIVDVISTKEVPGGISRTRLYRIASSTTNTYKLVTLNEYNVGPVGVTNDKFLTPSHGLSDDDTIQLLIGTGTTGVSSLTTYYVVGSSAHHFQLSLTMGGAAINITAVGNGHWFQPGTFTNLTSEGTGIVEILKSFITETLTGSISGASKWSKGRTPIFNGNGNVLTGNTIEDANVAGISMVSYVDGTFDQTYIQHHGICANNTITRTSPSTIGNYYALNIQGCEMILTGNTINAIDRNALGAIVAGNNTPQENDPNIWNYSLKISENTLNVPESSYGIYLSGGYNSVAILNNTILNDTYSIYCIGENGNLIISGNQLYGYVFTDSGNCSIKNNEIAGPLFVSPATNTFEDYIHIDGNRIVSESFGIFIDQPESSTWKLVTINNDDVTTKNGYGITIRPDKADDEEELTERIIDYLQINETYLNGRAASPLFGLTIARVAPSILTINNCEIRGGQYETALYQPLYIDCTPGVGQLRIAHSKFFHNKDTTDTDVVSIVNGSFASARFTDVTFGHDTKDSNRLSIDVTGEVHLIGCNFQNLNTTQINCGSNVTDIYLDREIVTGSNFTAFDKGAASGSLLGVTWA